MGILDLSWKQIIAFHGFELVYLAVLGVLPFIVWQPFVLTCCILLFGSILVISLYKKITYKKIEVKGQGVVITGCDTGFGHGLAKRLDRLGFVVIAGCLDPNSEGANALRSWGSTGRLHVVPLDVTKDEQVNKAVEYVKEHCPEGLWALVNNAAVNFVGDVEFCTMDMYKMVAEVNQFGVIRMTKAFLPEIRKSKGRVINVTSAKGRLCLPINAVYGAAKYAIEAFSDVLRLEMKKFGVKVVIVEPGDFGGTTGMLSPKTLSWIEDQMKTMWDSASEEVKSAYGREYFDAVFTGTKAAAKEAAKSMAPVVDAMEDAVINVSPSIRYLVDGSIRMVDYNNFLIRIRSYIPDSWLDWLLDQKYNRPMPKIPKTQ